MQVFENGVLASLVLAWEAPLITTSLFRSKMTVRLLQYGNDADTHPFPCKSSGSAGAF